MKVFVDANIYLGFIRLSQDKIDYLLSFKKLIKQKKIKLIFPQITQDEVFRNIPYVTNTHLKEIDSYLPNKPKFAVSVRGKTLARQISKLYEKYKSNFMGLREGYLKSVEKFEQKILIPLTKQAIRCHDNEDHFSKAEYRRKKGNPPGKGDHLGDEIAWELMLSDCIDDDLVIISNDYDWKSPLVTDTSTLHPYLIREWKEKSNKTISYFDSLGVFMKTQYSKKVKESDIVNEKRATLSVERSYPYFSGSLNSTIIPSGSLSGTTNYYPSAVGSLSNSLGHIRASHSHLSNSRLSDFIVCPNCSHAIDRSFASFQMITIICPNCGTAISID